MGLLANPSTLTLSLDPPILRREELEQKSAAPPLGEAFRRATTVIRVATGLDVFRDGYYKQLRGRRLGLLSNQASLDSTLVPAKEVIARLLPGQLKALFGPQHGHGGQDQDNMIETPHSRDRDLDIPVYSLYAEKRAPSPEMLDQIDTLIIDLQDVGTRVYTFASTMLGCLKAAARSGREVLVLDRPNPLGGEKIEGNLLMPELFSFVGPFALPMRHGLTMGELALLFNDRLQIGCDLKVAAMIGWRRDMLWYDTGLRWMMPSPNMPFPETAQVYPGQVTWEGTNVSEGRGTCRPFEVFGAPYLDSKRIKEGLRPEPAAGCALQEVSFRPTFHKWEGELCAGFMIHVTDPRDFRPYLLSLSLLHLILGIHGDRFQWKDPPYEYEFTRMPMDLILGDLAIRRELEKGSDPLCLARGWDKGYEEFLENRRSCLLY